MRILVCGLPGSGKTTYCEHEVDLGDECGCQVVHINADKMREAHCDFDFSMEGRIRQAHRMRAAAESCEMRGADVVLVDMVAPTRGLRAIIAPDKIIFMDTIKEGRYPDTNRLFEPPTADEAPHFAHIFDFLEG